MPIHFRRQTHHAKVMATVFIAIAIVSGCSQNKLDRVPVQGTVLFKEQPVANGEVRFVPIESTKGPVSIGAITEGKYTIDTNGGVPSGKYRVEIQILGQVKDPASSTQNASFTGAVRSIGPPVYDSPQSPLTAEIPGNNRGKLDFQIP